MIKQTPFLLPDAMTKRPLHRLVWLGYNESQEADMHLIRFSTKKEHKRALMAFLQVPRIESLLLPDRQMVVEDEHIWALDREKISFTYLSNAAANGKKKTPVQR